ncbi:MAG TPA: M1 family aminopeptidase, partial [Pyrinomonadaceae bacterium]|nr:M1 family aminopeptidase [Pyrinomonadaceae bacterium]
LDAAAGDLVLDWRTPAPKDGKTLATVRDVVVNGRRAAEGREVRVQNEHLVVSSGLLRRGENVVRLSFESPVSATGTAAVTRYRDREDGAEYLYTLFVPSDASTAFPCFDQPDLKARFRLEVNAPPDWKVISNTPAEHPKLSDAHAGRPTATGEPILSGVITTRFPETRPISTYVFAFAAGPFAEFEDPASPLRTKLYVRRSKAEAARKELTEVFRLNRDGIKFFEGYFARPFPFPKYDLVIIPEFPFRGMEHAGATFLREESVLFPSDPTAVDLWARADIMLHEAAHQWFGDLVTMRWFDDLWLKEGFATFMASKAIEKLMPQYDAWKVFYLRTKPLAYETDVTKGTTPIWQEIQNLSAAKSAYGNIVYRKAPSMLRQAEFYLGADKFQRAVRLFLKEHAYSNAEWDDLVRAFERTSGQKLDAWAAAWVRRRGMPDVRVEWAADRQGRLTRMTLRQQDVLGEGGAWPMRLRVLLAYPDGALSEEALTVRLDGARPTSVRDALGRRRPDYVFVNYEDYGYGRFLLDARSRRAVIERLGSVRDDFLRALLWGALWESVREAELPPVEFVELAVRHVARERDEVAAQFVLARAETAFNRYLSEEQRRRAGPALERLLFDRMMNAETTGLRITYFRAYRQVATSDEAFARLGEILSGRLSVPGMTLRARDRFDIAAALLAADCSAADSTLEKLSAEHQTDDGRRYAFATGAARADAASKRKYFESFLSDRQLAESWIEAAVVPFNHPRHSALTLPLLEAALSELPTLKRTRKIFFVNGWLAAFIGGQCDERAAGVVRDFLARHPDLDRDLRLKVLEASDGLERCVRIRARHASPSGARPAPAP